MTWDGSANAPGVMASSGSSFFVTSDAAIVVDSGMSADAMTTNPVVGELGGFGRPPPTTMTDPTKATIARKTPMSRTRRLERFKLLLPERLVTGGTTVAPAQRLATIRKA